MSYDLLLRRQISGSVARDDSEEGRLRPGDVSLERALLAPAAGLAAAAALALLVSGRGRVGKRVERTYYRATRRDLTRTQETPAVTMREMVYGGK
jgi:hypothetical protein